MVRRDTKDIDFEAYYDAKFRQMMDEDIIKAVDKITGRDLYEQSTISGTANYLVNRPVTYGLHGTEINYKVDPQAIMRDCLVDGLVVLKIGDPENITIQKDVNKVTYKGDSSKLMMVQIQYFVQNPNDSRPDAQDYIHREEWYRWFDGTRDAAWVYIYNTVAKEEDFKVIMEFEFPYFPFVGINWIDKESHLEQVKKSIIRLEGVTINISTENTRHSGRKMFITGMKKSDNIVNPRDTQDRINYLPEDAEAFYVDVDTGGVGLMFEEQEKVEAFIERTSGVVSIKQLAGLSGESRQIAETPLVQIAEEVRVRFETGMKEVVFISQDYFGVKNTAMGMESPELVISYRFLRFISDKKQHLEILKYAVKRGAVDDDEESKELRRLLILNQRDPATLPGPGKEQEETGVTNDV